MLSATQTLFGILSIPVAWVAIAVLGLLGSRSISWVARILFPLGGIAGFALGALALLQLAQPAASLVLPLGLSELPFHVRVDGLSCFFLLLLGFASGGISLFASGYFRAGEGAMPGLLCLQYHVFLASMATVLVADDAYLFMVAWETMALSSYFLVTSQHRLPEIRRAGFIYLIIAHVGAIGILLSFGVLQGGSWQFTFDAMRAARLSPLWSSVAFFLAMFGFGAKAGIVPLHVWLPEAHPAAPSPVSALMSGVMLKTAIYGVLRVSFDLLHVQLWWWGLVALGFGLFTAFYGVIFASVQTDMKRLLAYSSIENIGILFLGIGLTLLFHAFGMPRLAALALAATLYHALNHAFFKSLLFLATGSVLHSTRERNLGRLGGLIHRMPWVAWLALIGTLAIAGLPPLNGFVSEWLLLQAFLFTPQLPHQFINMLLPIAAAALALVAALAAYVMVKFYGVIFLGQPREPKLAQAHDCGRRERVGLLWLAAGCVLLGLFPVHVLALLDGVSQQLLGAGLGGQLQQWWLLAPIAPERASYSPAVFMLGILVLVALTGLVVHRVYHGRVRQAPPWACGFPQLTPRMQDTAEGFGQPIRQIFEPFFRMQRELPTAFDASPHYHVKVEDRLWYALYLPVVGAVQAGARVVSLVQQGRIGVYLLFSFVTLVALLVFVL
ncbi:MAG TPA: hydrogenase 4 subunit B [Gammaproteobacteria bacterium]|nr:hydrogenase 4 subunit B [Gammaproteobacteria bacterium]